MQHRRRRCVQVQPSEKESKHFMKAILPSPIHAKQIYVPAEFAPKYLKPYVPFKLQNSQGKQWEVSCVLHKKGKSMRITIGFRKFARDNNLLKGVIYNFELIKSEPVIVLEVTAAHMPWQQKCVRSSEEKGLGDSEHFKKAILPSPIHAKQIKIPDNFITLFGNELNNVAKVTVPDGRVWDIELKKCGENVIFCNKWQQFAEFYSIEYGCYLSFKYEGKSMFSVIIFDATSVEIVYPFKTPSNDGELYTKCPSPRKRSKVETSKSRGKKLKSMSIHASKRAEVAAIEFKPSYPYFRSKIAKQRYVYVRCDFAAKYLKQNVPIKVQNAHGEEWEVFCIPNTFGSSEMRIVRGFPNFQRANNLSHGDYCVFELVKKKPVVLKVTMFRTVDYCD